MKQAKLFEDDAKPVVVDDDDEEDEIYKFPDVGYRVLVRNLPEELVHGFMAKFPLGSHDVDDDLNQGKRMIILED